MSKDKEIIDIARQVIDDEVEALVGLKNYIDENFEEIINVIYKCKGRLIFTGIGKSGHISKKISATLSSENLNQLWIPDGFAHGFLTLSDSALVQYKVTNYWSKECEKSLIWNDKEVDIDWPFEPNEKYKIKLSKKDEEAPTFNEISKLNFF